MIDAFSLMKNRIVYIWGANDVGDKISRELEKLGIIICGFIDSFKEGMFSGHDIKKFDDVLSENPYIVVAVREYKAIERQLQDNGFDGFIDYICANRKLELVNPSYYQDVYGNSVLGQDICATCNLNMNGEIKAGKNIQYGRRIRIACGVFSSIYIGDNCVIGNDVNIEVCNFSKLYVGDGCVIKDNANLKCTNNSSAVLKDRVVIGVDNEVWIHNKGKLLIGNDSGFDEKLIARIYNGSTVTIGEDCMFSYDIRIRGDQGHAIIFGDERVNRKGVFIGNHVWVGMNSIIAPGADIGDNCMIGAASFVNCKLTGGNLCVGTPAKEKKSIATWVRDP